jgi:post-segregation antitoxin (ccd killing protein)
MNNSPSKQQLNIYLPPELIVRVKHKAIDVDVTVSTFVEQALRHYLEHLKQNSETSVNHPDS